MMRPEILVERSIWYIMALFTMATASFGQVNEAIVHTELGLSSLNEINILVSIPMAKNMELEVKIGANVNSRILSNECGLLGWKQSVRVQEHQSMLGGIAEMNYLWTLRKWFRLGPQTFFRLGSAKNVKIQSGCWGGSGQDPEEYDIDLLFEWGLGLKLVFGRRDDRVNLFFSGGSRNRIAQITRREPWQNGKKTEESMSMPMFNAGIKIRLFSLKL